MTSCRDVMVYLLYVKKKKKKKKKKLGISEGGHHFYLVTLTIELVQDIVKVHPNAKCCVCVSNGLVQTDIQADCISSNTVA